MFPFNAYPTIMKKLQRSWLIAIGIVLFLPSVAQNNRDILMTVNGDEVTKKEFLTIYQKNNRDSSITKESLDEYLELFINFKLKVKEAEAMGLDTMAAFRKELRRYRHQLAQPYLTDKEVKEELIREAYDRMKQEVRVKHIMVKVGENAPPKDTAEAYREIMKIKKRLQGGEDFEKVAREVSEDPAASKNGGDLGYFSAFQMVYPFETAAYETPEGETTGPVRTRYGYHLIKVIDKRKARGRIKVGHIMLRASDKMEQEDRERAKKKIREIHEKLKNGEEGFRAMARKYSEDRRSATKGGELSWFSTGDMVKPFEEAAFALERDGQISKPVRTRFGWHIIKRIDHEPVGSFEEMRSQLKKKVSEGDRSSISKKTFIKKLKKAYDFQVEEKTLNKLASTVDTSIFNGKWEASGKFSGKTLFKLDGELHPVDSFAVFLEERQRQQKSMDVGMYVREQFHSFVDKTIMSYERSRLDEKYPEFRALMQEYRDGILLFDLSDEKVWTKAVKDSVGLKGFYEAHKSDYQWGERVDATVFKCKDEKTATRAKELARAGLSARAVRDSVNQNSSLNVSLEEGKFEKDDLPYLDQFEWKKGVTEIRPYEGQHLFLKIREVLLPRPKTLEEARGIVTSDYQDHLEKKWVEQLREKYDVKVNKEVLYSIVP